MNMSDKNVNSCWAIQTENHNSRDMMESADYGSYPKAEADGQQMNPRDLRYKLRRSRDEDQRDDHARSHHKSNHFSPTKSPAYQRQRNTRDSDMSRPNYVREKDGLSPLRSPLNAEQRSSRVNPSYRRRSDTKIKKENEQPKSSSPSKRDRHSCTLENSKSPLSRDVEEQKFRRRLDLPNEKESGSEEEEEGKYLNPEKEKDRIAIERREKQIAYGKSTDSYKLYIRTVPKEERSVDRKKHPRTPIKTSRCSRRNWDAQISAWKKYTHHWANVNGSTTPGQDPSEAESDEKSSAIENGMGAEDNNLDLNEEEEDESFLEGFELDYQLVQET